MLRLLSICGVLAGLAMASSARAGPSEDLAVVSARPQRFSEAWAQHDARGLAAIMSKDVDFVNVGAIWLHGRDFEAYHDRILKGRFKASTNRPLATKVSFIRPDIAVVRWSWKIDGEALADGTPAPTRYGLMTFIVEKRDGKWLITNAQNTNAGPQRAEADGLDLPILVPRNP
ncbi:MAG: hypothetical protein JWQ52_1934 [Phenylobacterium sp.]|nr:hypothetical protein [Phenylobacterium sp.]